MIYEEKKNGGFSTVLFLVAVFLLTVSPWALELRSLYWNEGTFAAIVREIASFPPLLTLHGESASGVFPLYPLIVKIIHSCGFSMEFSLRIVPVIALATQKNVYEKTISNAKETRSRGARVLLFTTKDAEVPEGVATEVIRLDEYDDILMPLQLIVPLQLFAYYMAVLRGCDVDKPRNLAKSVTVE